MALLALPHEQVALRLARHESLPHIPKVGRALRDRTDQAFDGALRSGDLPVDLIDIDPPIGALLLDLVMVGFHQQRDGVGAEQVVGDAGQHALLDLDALDRLTDIAGAGLAVARAADTAVANDDHRAAAPAAAHQPG